MEFGSIYHRASHNWCYPINKDTLEIKIQTGLDIDSVKICHGDPYEGGIMGGNWQWQGQVEEIFDVTFLQHHKIWRIQITPKFKRLKYHFEIHCQSEIILLYENGLMSKAEANIPGRKIQSFVMPWINEIDINTPPAWVKQTIWYQIFPERFEKGSIETQDEFLPWGSKIPSNKDVYGGNLQGIINRLDYLSSLGINGIYLNPIFKASSSHKYDTADYYEIDPSFGNKTTFKTLVEQCHKRGIKIMLDGVFNHCGEKFPYWLDVLKNGQQSKYYDWFMINKWPIDPLISNTRNNEYYSFAFEAKMPKLNTNNPTVIEYIAGICEYWIREFDIDGWRLDVANEISHELCKVIHKRTKALKPDIYILGEVWHDSINWLNGDEFDGVMNYPLTSAIDDFWCVEEATNRQLEYALNQCYQRYMKQTNDALFNLLDSHDTERLFYRVNQNKDIYYQQMVLLFTMPGSVSLYYGSEILMDGGHDPLNRACMPWLKIDSGVYNEDLQLFKKLIHLRKNNQAFLSQNFKFTYNYNHPRIIEYIKDNNIKVVLNCSDKKIKSPKGKMIFSRKSSLHYIEPGGIHISIQ